MSEGSTLAELVAEVGRRIQALPAPRNGQVRAVPDDRTVRYYQTIGLLDRPLAMRGRTALYGARHLAQVVAIKRLQATGKSLAEIQALWPTLDDATLARMTGVVLPGPAAAAPVSTRREFWKRDAHEPVASASSSPHGAGTRAEVPAAQPALAPAELRIQLAPNVSVTIALADEAPALHLSHADVRAIRAAAAALVAELAARQLTTVPQALGEEEP